MNTISKFDSEVRAQVIIVSEDLPTESRSTKSEETFHTETNGNKFLNNNNNYCVSKDENSDDKELIKVIESKVIETKNGDQLTSNLHPSIVALTAACSEKILNPEYLLQGGGSPFVGGEPVEVKNGNGIHPGTSKQAPVKELKTEKVEKKQTTVKEQKPEKISEEDSTRPTIVLRSQKMRGLKDLLLAEKLNTHAISLQLTAQSQVQVGKKGRGDSDCAGLRPKRTRRE